MRFLLVIAGLAFAGCQQSQPDGNAAAPATNVAEIAAEKCAPPALALADGSQLESKLLDETKASFATAYTSSCGILKDKALIDPKAADRGKLFLINAPEANVASIYLSEVDGNRMILEYPFLTADGKSQVPSAEELEEAIYCNVHGATPEEQEESGRCLVD